MIGALKKISTGISGLTILILLFASVGYGQEEKVDDDRMMKDAGNPITSVLNLPVQDNMSFGIGEYDRTMHLIKIQPVRLAFQTGRLYKIRSRSIIPLIYAPDITKPTGGVFGLGDIILTGFFSPNRLGRHIWGVGPVLSMPTATDKVLGSGKWSAGAEDRPEVNRMLIDPLFRYHLGHRWMLVGSPSIAADWTAPEGERWLVPLGGG